MAGWLAVSKEHEWSVSGWLFDWTVRYLISVVDDAQIEARLRVIHDDHLEMLNVDDFSPTHRQRLLRCLAEGLVEAGKERLALDLPNRPKAIALLEELAQLARDTT